MGTSHSEFDAYKPAITIKYRRRRLWGSKPRFGGYDRARRRSEGTGADALKSPKENVLSRALSDSVFLHRTCDEAKESLTR